MRAACPSALATFSFQGLIINRFAGDGIAISGAGSTGNVIQGNYLGTNAEGGSGLAATAVWYRGEGDGQDTVGGNHAIVNGAGFAAGFVGQSLEFDGIDDEVRGTIPLGISGDAAMTIEHWVYLQDTLDAGPGITIGDVSIVGGAFADEFNYAGRGVISVEFAGGQSVVSAGARSSPECGITSRSSRRPARSPVPPRSTSTALLSRWRPAAALWFRRARQCAVHWPLWP